MERGGGRNNQNQNGERPPTKDMLKGCNQPWEYTQQSGTSPGEVAHPICQQLLSEVRGAFLACSDGAADYN